MNQIDFISEADDVEIPEDSMLMFDSASGIFIPQRFAEEVRREYIFNVDQEDLDILEYGPEPENEHYWDAWVTVLDTAQFLYGNELYRMEQDGDVWMVKVADVVIAPAHWAPALINGDYSGIETESEDLSIQRFEDSLDGNVVDVLGEPEFMSPHFTDTPSQLAGDYIRYVVS